MSHRPPTEIVHSDCIDGNFFRVLKRNSHLFDFPFVIERLDSTEEYFTIQTVTMTLLGARLYLWKIKKLT